jgi:L-aminopeptidase/D-esterase-like protein
MAQRARDLGIIAGTGNPGPHNAITDVAGVSVGHTTLISGDGPLVPGRGPVRTGVTVVLPRPGPSRAPAPGRSSGSWPPTPRCSRTSAGGWPSVP